MRKYALVGAVLVAAVLAFIVVRQSSNTVVIGREWGDRDQLVMTQIDHGAWDELLQEYVNDEGLVDYRGWKSSGPSRKKLKEYLEHLSKADLTSDAPREASLAFWINAYNALTIHAMLDVYPTESIRNHTNPLGFDIWQHVKLMVSGTAYSLNDIEHQVLRKRFGEPRIHFAIVCASTSCPRLLNRAYIADRVEQQLVANTKHFFAQPRNFQLEGDVKVHLSSILKWFKQDFGQTDQDRRETIARFLEDDRERRILIDPETKISFINYDWTINEQK